MKFQISRYYLIATFLAISVLIESLCYTYMQQSGKVFYYSSSIVYALAGLVICFLPLFGSPAKEMGNKLNRFIAIAFVTLVTGFLIYHILILAPLYNDQPITKYKADMLPSIQLACKRFLSGQKVYALSPEIWPGSIEPYLPTMWMPFLPSEIFGYDARWTTFGAIAIGLIISMLPLFKRGVGIPILPAIISGIALFLLLNYFLNVYQGFWTMTEEAVVAGFYMVLCFALLRNNYWMIGLAITGCFLSRYTFLFWLPTYFVYVFFVKGKSAFWRLSISFGLSMLLLFILPFFIWDPPYFFHIPATYLPNAAKFWNDFDLVRKEFYCVGFHKFFTVEQTSLMFILSIITSFLAPVLFILFAIWIRKKYPVNDRYIVFGSLKICLLFFYGFLQMPYWYLFITPTIISYVVLFDFLRIGYNTNKNQSVVHAC